MRLLLTLALLLPACRPRDEPPAYPSVVPRGPGEVGEEVRGAWSDPP